MTVKLTLKAGDNWTGMFENLPVYADGQAIVYTIAEVGVPAEYTSKITGDAMKGFTVTNTFTPKKPPVKPKEIAYTGTEVRDTAIFASFPTAIGATLCSSGGRRSPKLTSLGVDEN